MKKYFLCTIAVVLVMVVLFASSSWAQSQPDPSKYDIAGIRLGMTVEEVRTAIRAHNLKLKVKEIKQKTPLGEVVVGYLQATEPRGHNDPRTVEEIDVAFTVAKPQVAYAIVRGLPFKDKGALKSEIVKQLHEKYGRESEVQSDFIYRWAFDEDSKQLEGSFMSGGRGRSKYDSCFHMTDGVNRISSDESSILINSSVASIPGTYYDYCGVSLSVWMFGDLHGNADLTSGLLQKLIDDRFAIADIHKQQSLEQGLKEREQQQRIKDAAETKPKL